MIILLFGKNNDVFVGHFFSPFKLFFWLQLDIYSGVPETEAERIYHLTYLVGMLSPVLEQVHTQEVTEKEIEAKIRGMFLRMCASVTCPHRFWWLSGCGIASLQGGEGTRSEVDTHYYELGGVYIHIRWCIRKDIKFSFLIAY